MGTLKRLWRKNNDRRGPGDNEDAEGRVGGIIETGSSEILETIWRGGTALRHARVRQADSQSRQEKYDQKREEVSATEEQHRRHLDDSAQKALHDRKNG